MPKTNVVYHLYIEYKNNINECTWKTEMHSDIQNNLLWEEQNSGNGIKDTNSMHKIDKEKDIFYSTGNFSHFLVITYYAVLKCWFKAQHSENKDHDIWSHHFMANRWGKQWKQCQTLFWGAQKSLQMVIAAMKLKDAYFLEGKI